MQAGMGQNCLFLLNFLFDKVIFLPKYSVGFSEKKKGHFFFLWKFVCFNESWRCTECHVNCSNALCMWIDYRLTWHLKKAIIIFVVFSEQSLQYVYWPINVCLSQSHADGKLWVYWNYSFHTVANKKILLYHHGLHLQIKNQI